MKEPKENHPIDHLFARKLKDHEQVPRSEAWHKLESRLNNSHTQRKGLPLWARYSAAASVAVLLLAGWWMIQPSTTSSGPELALEKPQVIKPIATPEQSPEAEITPNPVETPTERVPQTELAAAKKKEPRAKAIEPKPRPVPVEDQLAVTTSITSPTPQTVESKPSVTVSTSAPVEMVAQAATKTQEVVEPKVFIVKVTETGEAASGVASEEALGKRTKGKFFSRLAKGIKHIQEGEWKEVGLDGKTIMARTEDNLFKKN
ncbi:hypothetical protein [Siphonobacter sp.]|uniref:hypothetical protein n=1 Tax=Siphonobacter sp. TaxID=1869184 RepID=UPI003B3B1152